MINDNELPPLDPPFTAEDLPKLLRAGQRGGGLSHRVVSEPGALRQRIVVTGWKPPGITKEESRRRLKDKQDLQLALWGFIDKVVVGGTAAAIMYMTWKLL